jgi:predicted enzyme related to lactoylglutathione lyase
MAHKVMTDIKLAAVWYPVSQWDAAKAFYGEVLGLEESQVNDELGWAAYNSGSLPLFIIRRPELVAGGGAVATFRVDDVEALYDRLVTSGAQVDEQLQMSGNLLIMTFYDPDGNRLEAAQVMPEIE